MSTRSDSQPAAIAGTKPSPAPASGFWDGDDETSVGPWQSTPASSGSLGSSGHRAAPPQASSDPDSKLATSTIAEVQGLADEHQQWLYFGEAGNHTGRLVDDVLLGNVIGEGGMGTVYRAWQLSLSRRVAVKVMLTHLARSNQVRERFELEFKTLSRLQSPHVVQVFGAGALGQALYFSMEYFGGSDVQRLLSDSRQRQTLPPPNHTAELIRQAALGLAEAGRQGVVHRDIKPSNLMLNDQGEVKIADFGIAKLIGEHGVTVTGTAMGTPTYCSPEQGRGGRVDHRSDIYSLGVVLYELLCGQPPFQGASGNAMIYQHNYAEPPLPLKLRPDLDPRYQAIVLTCLQKEPTQRYQNAEHLAADLARVVSGHAPASALATTGTGASRMMRRQGLHRRRSVLLTAALVAAVSAIIGWWQWPQPNTTPAPSRSEQLRQQLAMLDLAQPVPANIRQQLSAFAELVPDDDPDLGRWRDKLQEMSALEDSWQAILPRLDGDPNARVEAQQLLRRWRMLLGPEEPQIQSHGELLAELVRRETDLRQELSAIDRQEILLPVDMARWSDLWDQLTRLVMPTDPDLRRWRDRLDAGQAYLAGLVDHVATITPTGPMPNDVVEAHRQKLLALAFLVGDQDQRVIDGRSVLSQAEREWQAMVANLTRLDGAQPFAGVSLIAETSSDLAQYQALVAPDDRRLQRWRDHVTNSQARVEELRLQLQPLDQQLLLSAADQQLYEGLLITYRRLVGADDTALMTWHIRLDNEPQAIDNWRQLVARFDDPAPLKQVAWEQLGRAVALGRNLVEPEQRNRWQQRLRRAGAELAVLRQSVAGPIGPWDEEREILVAQALQRLEPSPGLDRWRARQLEVAELRRQLRVLDQPGPLDAKIDQAVARFAELVANDNDELLRWQRRLQQQRALQRQLAVLDVAQPPGAGIPEALLAYAEVAGVSDADYRRWSQRWRDLSGYRQLIAGELTADEIVLRPAVEQAVAELSQLIGQDAPESVAARRHVERLIGSDAIPDWASRGGRDQFGRWAELELGGVVQRFRLIPPALVELGSPLDEPGRDADEQPVWVRQRQGFWLANTECTQALWAAVVRAAGEDSELVAAPSRFSGPQNPVEQVSHISVMLWLAELNAQVPGLRARLPSEVEWELAASAGYRAPYVGEGGPLREQELDRIAWFDQVCDRPQPVAQRNPNPLGLYDCSGNVWEWCLDPYAPYPVLPRDDRLGRGSRQYVVRGGSFADTPADCRLANRVGLGQARATMMVGFRIAIPLDQSLPIPAWPAQLAGDTLKQSTVE